MGFILRVLFIDDSEDDVLLIVRELRARGCVPVFERVDNLEALKAALRVPSWGVILCDYVMPKVKVEEALELCKRNSPDVPFIVMSGVYGEYIAARTIKAGAHDYIAKGDLARLGTTIQKTCHETETRRADTGGKNMAARAGSGLDRPLKGRAVTEPPGLGHAPQKNKG